MTTWRKIPDKYDMILLYLQGEENYLNAPLWYPAQNGFVGQWVRTAKDIPGHISQPHLEEPLEWGSLVDLLWRIQSWNMDFETGNPELGHSSCCVIGARVTFITSKDSPSQLYLFTRLKLICVTYLNMPFLSYLALLTVSCCLSDLYYTQTLTLYCHSLFLSSFYCIEEWCRDPTCSTKTLFIDPTFLHFPLVH